MSPMEQIQSKINAVKAIAATMYGVDMSRVRVSFDLKGRVAGYAGCRINRMSGETSDHFLKFNRDMIVRGDADALRDMIEDTVPHEIAHIVCYMRRELGRNHDAGWQRVCVALGGTGKRTHSTEVVYGKGTTYEYTTNKGNKVRLNDRRHRHVQAGGTLRYRKGLGEVTMGCAYSIVGTQGRTLAAPIVKNADHAPAVVAPTVPTVRPVFAPPVARVAPVVLPAALQGQSKAAISRQLMAAGYLRNDSYETIIAAMMAVNGYTRQLARGTFKANAARVGIPATFG
jgi:predicted SprT family Zn-dependent metalloprotease